MQLQTLLLTLQLLVVSLQGQPNNLKITYEMMQQIDCSGDELDPGMENGGRSCSERRDAGECNHDYMLYGGFCIKTCGFCEEQVEESAVLNIPGEIVPGIDDVAKSAIFFSQADKVMEPYMRTLRGCSCPTWTYNGTTYKGCANPNRSFVGGWCPVDPYTCMSEPIMRQKDPIEVIMDYREYGEIVVPLGGDREYLIDGCHCTPTDMCTKSVGGCSCKSPCTLSDFDVGGPWCEIEEGSCPDNYYPSRMFDYSGTTDYCKPGCCPSA
eukprot:TRINITY_DN23062_c2_g1_i1.p2 TRINITY_DN23062_c2_g1~~TRINITY_DN23062_c2_g1_i1.p2  ORF type:complete len:267 (+),score=35.41 TRINITY_DN23062_c2_g1_i1:138-938(+)